MEVARCSSKDALGQFDAVVDLRPTGLRLLRRVDELPAVIGCLNQDHGIGLATLAPGASAGVWPSAHRRSRLVLCPLMGVERVIGALIVGSTVPDVWTSYPCGMMRI